MNHAPTSDEEPLTLPSPSRGEGLLGEIASPCSQDSWGLRATLHLRVDKVLVFQLDTTDRAGDRLSRRRREDFVLLKHSTADVVEVTAGIFFI